MILLGLGANLPHPRWGAPERTLAAALRRLPAHGIRVVARSRWYDSAPDPPSAQPTYVNAVARIVTDGEPAAVLAALLAVEASLGRVRGARNAARTVDLDLLAHGGRAGSDPAAGLRLPHPRMHLRPFVLLPLAEVAPGWRHPALDRTVEEMIAALPPECAARTTPKPTPAPSLPPVPEGHR